MNKDFYDVIESKIGELNGNEKKILDYVVKHIHDVKAMGIRDLAEKMYVSTTSIFRFVKKLGFKGYSDFIQCLNYTSYKLEESKMPQIVLKEDYQTAYADNIVESIRVLSEKKMRKFNEMMDMSPNVYLIAEGMCQPIASYAKLLLSSIGIVAIEVYSESDVVSATRTVREGDLAFVIANDQYEVMVKHVERLKSCADIKLISITAAANNMIQGMTDLDFYIFTDEVVFQGIDLSSKVSMLAILELLIMNRMKQS